MCSIDQLNIEKIAWQENGMRPVQLNIPKIAMAGLIGCDQKHLRNYPTHTKKIKESLEINNFEPKLDYQCIK